METIFATLGFLDFAIIAWIVMVIAGAVAYNTRRTTNLRRIESKLDALLKHQGVSLPQPTLSEEVQRLARNPAHKIAALKLHREQTGLGLAEAKAEIEAFLANEH